MIDESGMTSHQDVNSQTPVEIDPAPFLEQPVLEEEQPWVGFTNRDPYQGLRPFEPNDEPFFCGRDLHRGEVLQRLRNHRFVAVVGLSGSGKSSLVRAGVIPELRAGLLRQTSSDWLIAMATPEKEPLERLCESLKVSVNEYARRDPSKDEKRWAHLAGWTKVLAEMVKNDSLTISEAITSARLPERTQVLLVVDQFEELFRYRQRQKKDEAASFVQQLLEATSEASSKVFAIITMRSEYMGDCALYPGLAEAVNRGLYLTPRLDREQLEQAIVLPAERCGRAIEPALVKRLLNDVANDVDQLPVLQHALMRCWDGSAGPITKDSYERVGGSDALNTHAKELMKELKAQPYGDEKVRIAEALFKRITKPSSRDLASDEDAQTSATDGQRDPAELGVICEQIGRKLEDVIPVLDIFRSAKVAFLRPGEWEQKENENKSLTAKSVIDITHESLIRKWEGLGKWVRHETEARDAYERLVHAAREAPSEHLSLYEMASYREFDAKYWNENWAKRYAGDYKQAIAYLQRSVDFYYYRRIWQLLSAAAAISVLFIIALWYKSAVVSRTLDFTAQVQKAQADQSTSADLRTSAAEGAYMLGGELGEENLGYLKQQLPWDKWELFSNLVKPEKFSRVEGQPEGSLVGRESIALTTDGSLLAVANGRHLRVLNTQSLEDIGPRITPADGAVFKTVSISPKGDYLAITESAKSGSQSSVQGKSGVQSSVPSIIRIFSRSSGKWSVKAISDTALKLSFVPSNEFAVLTRLNLKFFGLHGEVSTVKSFGQKLAVSGAFSSDGKYLVVLFQDGSSDVYDTGNKLPHKVLSRPSGSLVSAAAVSPNDCEIVIGSMQGDVTLYRNPLADCSTNAPTEPTTLVAQTDSAVTALAISNRKRDNATLIAAGGSAGNVIVCSRAYNSTDFSSPYPRPLGHQGAVTFVTFSADGSTIATTSSDQSARIFEPSTGIEEERVKLSSSAVFVSFVHQNAIVSASGDGSVYRTKLSDDNDLTSIRPQSHSCNGLVVGSAVLATGSWVRGCAREIDVDDDKAEKTRGEVLAMAESTDQSGFVWAEKRENQLVLRSGPELHEGPPTAYQQGPPPMLAMNGDFMVVAQQNPPFSSTISVLKANQNLSLIRTNSVLTTVSVGSGDRIAAGTAAGCVLYYDKDSLSKSSPTPTHVFDKRGLSVANCDQPSGLPPFTSLAFEFKAQYLVMARADRTVCVVPLPSGSPECSQEPLGGTLVVGSANRFASFSGNQIVVFSVVNRKIKKELTLAEPGNVQAVAFQGASGLVSSVTVNRGIELFKLTHNLDLKSHAEKICPNELDGKAVIRLGSNRDIDACNPPITLWRVIHMFDLK